MKLKNTFFDKFFPSKSKRSLHRPVQYDANRVGIAIVAIVKNESLYIAEWMAFYIQQGIRAFYIYDNGSVDNTADIVLKFSKLVDVVVIPWVNFGQHIRIQQAAYNHSLANFGHNYRWMLFIDVDEFLIPKTEKNLVSELVHFENFRALSFPWFMFGFGGHITRPSGLVIGEYTQRANFPPGAQNLSLLNYKTIVDPVSVRWMMTHFCRFWDNDGVMYNDAGKCFNLKDRFNPKNATSNHFQLNHYFTRSKEEFEAKVRKGRVSAEGQLTKEAEIRKRMERANRNIVEDFLALHIIDNVKELLCKVFPNQDF